MAHYDISRRAFNRRQFMIGAGVTAGAAAVTLANTQCDPALIRRIQQAKTATPPRHIVWVWQFSADGTAREIASTLGPKRLGVILKTHDGVEWMSKYDHSSDAISGPAQVHKMAALFEQAGVPFHAWAVIKGIDPVREAQMAADVLAAGARSLVLDLEGSSGFWVGSTADATRFGTELRTRTPFGRVDISIDPRPWRVNLVPMPELVAATDGIWPQLYWDTFDTPDNINGYIRNGFPPPGGRITPGFLIDATRKVLAAYDRPMIPVGQGAASDPSTWPPFAHDAWKAKTPFVSVWRYGVTLPQTLAYLGANPPGQEPKAPPATATPTGTHSPTPSPTRTTRPTRTPTATRTATRTPTPTSTAAAAPSATPTFSPTP